MCNSPLLISGLRSKFGSLSPHIGTQVRHVHFFSYNKGYFYRQKKREDTKSTAELAIEIKRLHPLLPLEWKIVQSLYICRLINSKIHNSIKHMSIYLLSGFQLSLPNYTIFVFYVNINICCPCPPPLFLFFFGGDRKLKGNSLAPFLSLVKLPMTETHENSCR